MSEADVNSSNGSSFNRTSSLRLKLVLVRRRRELGLLSGNRSSNGGRSGGILPVTGAQRAQPQRAPTPPPRPLSTDEADRRHRDQTDKARQQLNKDAPQRQDKQRDDGPQVFRNRAPANDENAANRIFDQVLNNAITVPVRDVLGASSDLRRLLQKFLTGRP